MIKQLKKHNQTDMFANETQIKTAHKKFYPSINLKNIYG